MDLERIKLNRICRIISPLCAFANIITSCVIYILAQSPRAQRRHSECILAPFAPLRDIIYFLRDNFFSPSRQERKGDNLKNLSALCAFARGKQYYAREPLLLTRFMSRQAANVAKHFFPLPSDIIQIESGCEL